MFKSAPAKRGRVVKRGSQNVQVSLNSGQSTQAATLSPPTIQPGHTSASTAAAESQIFGTEEQ
jgi:hypothetical protein